MSPDSAPRPTIQSMQEFLEVVRKSGLIEAPRLDDYLRKLTAEPGTLCEPSELAGGLVREGLLTHFQAEQLLAGKWKRFTIGPYKVLERLGVGNSCSVYLCEDTLLNRRLAVKVLPTARSTDSSSLNRFYRETRFFAALNHPNFVQVHSLMQAEMSHLLGMEHVDGTTLQEVIEKTGPMGDMRAAHYIRQAACGLQHAWETAGLVHCNIKPGKIMVDRNGSVKILGTSRVCFYNEDNVIPWKGNDSGLIAADYLAPELAVDIGRIDIRADLYSLGATFYFLLTGRPPFPEGTSSQKLVWHQVRQPVPVQQLCPAVPEGIAAIVARMMAKRPEDRYQTPGEVCDALAPWTQMPIPPPAAAEMPFWCLAAQGS